MVDSRNRRSILRVGGVVGAGVLLLLVGVAIGGGSTGPTTVMREPVTVDPLRAHSKTGAVAVTAAWLDATSSRAELLDSVGIERAVEQLVDPGFRDRIADQLRQVADAVRGGQQTPTPVVRSTPIGYQVTSYDDDRATVSSWEVVSRSSLQLAPAALWARSDVTLAWHDGWHVTAATSKLTDPADWSAVELAAMDRTYRSFHHVP